MEKELIRLNQLFFFEAPIGAYYPTLIFSKGPIGELVLYF